MDDFEFHVTVDLDLSVLDEAEDHARQLGFKSSYIKNDPLLGERTFFYYTGHANTLERTKTMMDSVANLPYHGNIVRRKIEKIVYDTKTGIGIP